LSGDGEKWFLVNASPDVRAQIEAFKPLWPPAASRRGSGIAGVFLTNADLDHTLGLLCLREGARLVVHSTAEVRNALMHGLNVHTIVNSYCGIEWREPAFALAAVRDPDGALTGLQYAAFAVPGKPPRYRGGIAPSSGDAVGYRFHDEATGGRLVVVPDLAATDAAVLHEMSNADLLLLDGTFFDEDEMQRSGAGQATAFDMGHLPVGGPEGSLVKIAKFGDVTRIYVHLNNTNPMLLEDSPQRAEVEANGVTIGYDGMEFTV